MNPINLQERIGQLAARWESQGRDEEHVYAVRNFLTGAGNTDIRQLIQDVCLEAVGEDRPFDQDGIVYRYHRDGTDMWGERAARTVNTGVAQYNHAKAEIRQNIKRLVLK